MSHAVETKFFSKWNVFWIGFAAMVVIILIWGASNLGSKAGSGTSAATTQGVYWQGTVGEQDEVKVHLPPHSWADLLLTGTVIVRLANNEKFEWRKDGSIYKIVAGGTLVQVVSVGDNIPGSTIYLLAKKGEKMVKVEVSTARKASRPPPTSITPLLPTPLIPVATPQSRGVTA